MTANWAPRKNSFWPLDRKSDSEREWIALVWWRAMGQPGFFDLDRRLEAISAKGDALETIKAAVPWEDFRADIEGATAPAERKSNAGRKPYGAVLKFKVLVLQSLYNLSDEQTELMIRDRLSFMRFSRPRA